MDSLLFSLDTCLLRAKSLSCSLLLKVPTDFGWWTKVGIMPLTNEPSGDSSDPNRNIVYLNDDHSPTSMSSPSLCCFTYFDRTQSEMASHTFYISFVNGLSVLESQLQEQKDFACFFIVPITLHKRRPGKQRTHANILFNSRINILLHIFQ